MPSLLDRLDSAMLFLFLRSNPENILLRTTISLAASVPTSLFLLLIKRVNFSRHSRRTQQGSRPASSLLLPHICYERGGATEVLRRDSSRSGENRESGGLRSATIYLLTRSDLLGHPFRIGKCKEQPWKCPPDIPHHDRGSQYLT